MTGRPCLCPPPFVRAPGRHLVGCSHAPGDTVAPARNPLERPPADPQAGDPTDVGTRGLRLAELDQAQAGRELLEQATGVDDTAAEQRLAWRVIDAARPAWDQPGADPLAGLAEALRRAWRVIDAAGLEAETRTVSPDRAAAERLGRVFDLPLPAFAPELCTPAELADYRARVAAGRRTARGRLLRARRWLERLVRR